MGYRTKLREMNNHWNVLDQCAPYALLVRSEKVLSSRGAKENGHLFSNTLYLIILTSLKIANVQLFLCELLKNCFYDQWL